MSSTSWINLDALWKIIVFGVLLGAGLPALFAVGLRALSFTPASSAPVAAESGSAPAAGGNLLGKVIAVLCFAVVLAAIGWGVYKIVNPN
jgi:hypothetical protein